MYIYIYDISSLRVKPLCPLIIRHKMLELPSHTTTPLTSGVLRGGFGVFKPSHRNSEDIGGVLDRMSKNRRFNFLL